MHTRAVHSSRIDTLSAKIVQAEYTFPCFQLEIGYQLLNELIFQTTAVDQRVEVCIFGSLTLGCIHVHDHFLQIMRSRSELGEDLDSDGRLLFLVSMDPGTSFRT
ncbi:hypothetical protein O6H91_Y351900 [Diphasiastrum complanatum]|nr:hypothetical protein O6H91_Y351900 [Diphasiastrum complanatum]